MLASWLMVPAVIDIPVKEPIAPVKVTTPAVPALMSKVALLPMVLEKKTFAPAVMPPPVVVKTTVLLSVIAPVNVMVAPLVVILAPMDIVPVTLMAPVVVVVLLEMDELVIDKLASAVVPPATPYDVPPEVPPFKVKPWTPAVAALSVVAKLILAPAGVSPPRVVSTVILLIRETIPVILKTPPLVVMF